MTQTKSITGTDSICECGRPAVSSERYWGVARATTDDIDATVTGWHYTGNDGKAAVCYPVTVDRSSRAPYRAHTIRMAQMRGDDRTADLLAAWGMDLATLEADADRLIIDWIERGAPTAKDGGELAQ